MSVGHIAREFEKSGIATVIIAVKPFAGRLEIMSLPRVLLTDNLIGRVLGPPHNTNYQRRVLEKAIDFLVSAERNGSVEVI
jgi:hypothetical protein